MSSAEFYNSYSPVGDVLVIATCMMFFVLIWAAFISQTKSYRLFRNILFLICMAAVSNILFYVMLLDPKSYNNTIIYFARSLYHISLISVLYLYMEYIQEALNMDKASSGLYMFTGRVAIVLFIIYELLESYTPVGFHIDDNSRAVRGINVFPFAYLLFVSLLIAMIYFNKKRAYKQIVFGVGGTIAISFLVMLIQGFCHQRSFTTATFLFPSFAVLYLIHSNPYDFESGSVNSKGFEDSIEYYYEQQKELMLIGIDIHAFELNADSFSSEIKEVIRKFVEDNLKKTVVFQIAPSQMVLSFETDKNPKYDQIVQKLYETFQHEYKKYQRDYKLIATKTYMDISANSGYLSLFRYIKNRMADNSLYIVSDEDIENFRKHEYILSELADITEKADMNDERVLVFCQPVYNILTGKYDTAEALMRLKLEKLGMVFPDQFIPMAEKYNYIQMLSMIILSKTCRQTKKMLDEGFKVTRVSINFSAIDIRDINFCDNVSRIIRNSGVPFEKIAIEITESQSEKDFLVMKEKVTELQKTGIKFYLDDFGTGYSNYDRILEIPFDIIKFDRSLTTASGSDEKSEMMVSHLANLFADMGYAVLYEGVEDERDEERCINMCAKYLQGYKYSKPIPLEGLADFFERKAI